MFGRTTIRLGIGPHSSISLLTVYPEVVFSHTASFKMAFPISQLNLVKLSAAIA